MSSLWNANDRECEPVQMSNVLALCDRFKTSRRPFEHVISKVPVHRILAFLKSQRLGVGTATQVLGPVDRHQRTRSGNASVRTHRKVEFLYLCVEDKGHSGLSGKTDAYGYAGLYGGVPARRIL
jgi:hypothetical protein